MLEKFCTKMYTIFSTVQRRQRKSDVMTSFGLTACSAVYYHAGSSLDGVITTTALLSSIICFYFIFFLSTP
jgi:hypothetical protein